MPLNVRRFFISIFLVLAGFVTFSSAQTAVLTPAPAQTTAQQPPATNTNIQKAPTSGDVMRDRISKAKAYIAVRNYNAAIYELENIRKETGDAAVQSVVNVLLMNSYLEQGDYKRAQDFLGEFYNLQKTTKPGATTNYMAIAGQVVKGARGRADRYKALGLSVGDRTLPLEALNDLEKMRETVELVITQSKEIGKTPARTGDAMAMLEEATQSRSMIARDDYDAKRWRDEVADARETMANSRSVVLSAVNGENVAASPQLIAENKPAPPPVTQPQYQPANAVAKTDAGVNNTPANTTPDNTPAKPANDAPVYVPLPQPVVEKPKPTVEESKPAVQPVGSEATPDPNSPLEVGSLLSYATIQPPPVYPAVAKSMRASGTVRVDLTVDEKGDVAHVEKLSGPSLLQGAAKDAIKRWKFRPFTRGGQPVKATGFVSFNFNL
jgi:TonB family protein